MLTSASAQTAVSASKKFIFFPGYKPEYEFSCFAGLSLAQLPTKIVEDVFDQVPMIELKASLGLPYSISAGAELNTNIFTNQLSLSPAYSAAYKNFSFKAGSDILFWYGFYKDDGFNVSVLGWGYSPFVSAGYDFNDFLLSVRLSADIKAQSTYMRKISYKNYSPEFKGLTMSFAVEQPLWNDHWFALGFRANYTTFFYKSWISFSTFEQYTFYPEFFAGFIL
ncbi:MAG: hypothetical protein ACM3Q2_18535 [Syntrophothermus sp.]